MVFTADHGDMMGERGMWYKFNPFEWSVRVPLIVQAPGNAKGRRESKSVSLVDLLPTLLDLATDGSPPDLVEPVDGHTWSGMLHGEDDSRPDEAMVEFTAEGAIAPCLILRKGPYKYVYSEPDPGMLFNVESDPGEQENLCGSPEHQAFEQEMLADILSRWDPQGLKDEIIESQQRRHFIQGCDDERPPGAVGLPAVQGRLAAVPAQWRQPDHGQGPRPLPLYGAGAAGFPKGGVALQKNGATRAIGGSGVANLKAGPLRYRST